MGMERCHAGTRVREWDKTNLKYGPNGVQGACDVDGDVEPRAGHCGRVQEVFEVNRK